MIDYLGDLVQRKCLISAACKGSAVCAAVQQVRQYAQVFRRVPATELRTLLFRFVSSQVEPAARGAAPPRRSEDGAGTTGGSTLSEPLRKICCSSLPGAC